MKQDHPLRILSFGAGAIGGYLGLALAKKGHAVTFLERPHNIEELRNKGIRLLIGDDHLHLSNFNLASSLTEVLTFGPFDIALFAFKSYDTEAILKNLAKHKNDLPPFLCLQNGVDNEIALRKVLGENNVIAGTITTSIGKSNMGELVLERKRGIGIGGEHPFSARLAELFSSAGLNAKLYSHSLSMKWSKLLTNLLANAQSAIHNQNPQQILENRESYKIEIAQLREALVVMQKMNLKVVDLPGTPVRALALAVKFLPRAISQPFIKKAAGAGRGGKMPSLHIDLHNGKGKSEVAWLNGAVVEWGKKYGLESPVNQMLINNLLKLVDQERGDMRKMYDD